MEALGNLGDFIGGIGVIVTLIYLATQIRQNTRATRSETVLGLTNAWQDYLLYTAQPDTAALMTMSQTEPDSLSEVEVYRLYVIARMLFRRFENDLMQSRSGTFDADVWSGYQRSLLRDVLASPTNRALWKLQRGFFTPDFVEFMDGQIEALQSERDMNFSQFVVEFKEATRQERASN